jgi:hypothetical protein
MSGSFDLSVTRLDGGPDRVRATPCGVPGLAIHAPADHVNGQASGWVITHIASGLCAGWWPEVSPEQVLAAAQALGELGDWTVSDLDRLPCDGRTVLELGGSIRCTAAGPRHWRSLDADGCVVVTEYVDSAAA